MRRSLVRPLTAGQLRFLLNVADLISGIRGIAIEKSDLSVELTPRETVEFIRQRHSRLMNNQPATQPLRRQAVHRTAESVALGEGFGAQGRLGLVRRCAVSEA